MQSVGNDIGPHSSLLIRGFVYYIRTTIYITFTAFSRHLSEPKMTISITSAHKIWGIESRLRAQQWPTICWLLTWYLNHYTVPSHVYLPPIPPNVFSKIRNEETIQCSRTTFEKHTSLMCFGSIEMSVLHGDFECFVGSILGKLKPRCPLPMISAGRLFQ